MTDAELIRCRWAGLDPLTLEYHDREWAVPLHDDRRLFEMLTLEGAQAGLSWRTILYKRENYRRAFEGFDPNSVASYTEGDVERLLADPGIVRNRLKVQSTISNAQRVLEVAAEFGSFDAYLWGLVGGHPAESGFSAADPLPARTEASDALSKELKGRGFRFVGSTICYAFMQAVGMVNDHTVDCFRYRQV
ncbi:MAG: DNA-3-methyladenine glycosylase I [Dehalococcoidia bacterium]